MERSKSVMPVELSKSAIIKPSERWSTLAAERCCHFHPIQPAIASTATAETETPSQANNLPDRERRNHPTIPVGESGSFSSMLSDWISACSSRSRRRFRRACLSGVCWPRERRRPSSGSAGCITVGACASERFKERGPPRDGFDAEAGARSGSWIAGAVNSYPFPATDAITFSPGITPVIALRNRKISWLMLLSSGCASDETARNNSLLLTVRWGLRSRNTSRSKALGLMAMVRPSRSSERCARSTSKSLNWYLPCLLIAIKRLVWDAISVASRSHPETRLGVTKVTGARWQNNPGGTAVDSHTQV